MASSSSIRVQITACQNEIAYYDELIAAQQLRVSELQETKTSFLSKKPELESIVQQRVNTVSAIRDLGQYSVSARQYADFVQEEVGGAGSRAVYDELDEMQATVNKAYTDANDELSRLKDERTRLQNQLVSLNAELDAALRREEAERQAAAAAAAQNNNRSY